jgi:hypothetical protein
MTGLVRKAALFAAFGLLTASAAMAGVPSPCDTCLYDQPAAGATNANRAPRIVMVGSLSGAADAAAGRFMIHIKDLAGNPISGASVVVDLSQCHDLSICTDQLDAGATQACPAKTTRKFADVNGWVSFTVLGGSNGAGNATTLLNGGRIYANGTLYMSPTVAAFDLDGSSGVGANDLSAWLTDFGSGSSFGRSDYDLSPGIGANDLSIWLTEFGAGTSAASCPTGPGVCGPF